MTRINVIAPCKLTGPHLVAEYRELPRIPNAVRKHQEAGLTPADFKIPPAYVLGTGHVTFFYDKLEYLRIRYQDLIREMRRRGYNPQFTYPNDLFFGLDEHWMNYYIPPQAALDLNQSRITERLMASKELKDAKKRTLQFA